MNWLTKAISIGEKIKKVLRKRPSKEGVHNRKMWGFKWNR